MGKSRKMLLRSVTTTGSVHQPVCRISDNVSRYLVLSFASCTEMTPPSARFPHLKDRRHTVIRRGGLIFLHGPQLSWNENLKPLPPFQLHPRCRPHRRRSLLPGRKPQVCCLVPSIVTPDRDPDCLTTRQGCDEVRCSPRLETATICEIPAFRDTKTAVNLQLLPDLISRGSASPLSRASLR